MGYSFYWEATLPLCQMGVGVAAVRIKCDHQVKARRAVPGADSSANRIPFLPLPGLGTCGLVVRPRKWLWNCWVCHLSDLVSGLLLFESQAGNPQAGGRGTGILPLQMRSQKPREGQALVPRPTTRLVPRGLGHGFLPLCSVHKTPFLSAFKLLFILADLNSSFSPGTGDQLQQHPHSPRAETALLGGEGRATAGPRMRLLWPGGLGWAVDRGASVPRHWGFVSSEHRVGTLFVLT